MFERNHRTRPIRRGGSGVSGGVVGGDRICGGDRRNALGAILYVQLVGLCTGEANACQVRMQAAIIALLHTFANINCRAHQTGLNRDMLG